MSVTVELDKQTEAFRKWQGSRKIRTDLQDGRAIMSYHYPFAVARFYRHWHDLTDEKVISDLAGFRKVGGRRSHD